MSTRVTRRGKGIAVMLALSLSIGGLATTVAAADGDNAGDAASSSSAAPATTKANAAADPNSPTVLELKELEATVADQTKQFDEHSKELDEERTALHEELLQIADLESKLGVTPDSDPAAVSAPVAAAVVDDPSSAQQNTQTTVPQDWSTRVNNLEDRLKDFGPFSFSGDIRLRDEPFFGGPSNQSFALQRKRQAQ